MNDNNIDLKEDDITARAKPLQPMIGIYFLVLDKKIVYVGQSVNMMARLYIHQNNYIKFDSVYAIRVPEENLNEVEAHYIAKFKPAYNKGFPKNSMWATLNQIKRDLGANSWALKKFIKKNAITDTNGYYLWSDFVKFNEGSQA